MDKQTKDKIIFILALLLMGVRINLVGSISLTELYVIIQAPHLIRWWIKLKPIYPEFRKISFLFILLFIFQAISEIAIQNSITNAVKGLAITFVTFFLILFFLEKLLKNPSLIKWIPLCACLRLILWGDQFGFSEVDETSYFKFYLAPIIVHLMCFLTLYKNNLTKKIATLLFLSVGIFIIIGGARSLGFSVLFSALLLFLLEHIQSLSIKKILPGIIVLSIAFQLFYANIYIPKVISGEWGSKQNREQLATINNSKNPFMMLFAARTDFFVSWKAFMDKPFFGHGSWAKDKDLKYYHMQVKLLHDKKIKKQSIEKLVPMHSVVVAMGTRNGMIPFLIFLGIYLGFYYLGFKSFYKDSIINPYLAYTLISSMQHLLFGPPAILKNSGAIVFAIILTLFFIKYHLPKYQTCTIKETNTD